MEMEKKAESKIWLYSGPANKIQSYLMFIQKGRYVVMKKSDYKKSTGYYSIVVQNMGYTL